MVARNEKMRGEATVGGGGGGEELSKEQKQIKRKERNKETGPLPRAPFIKAKRPIGTCLSQREEESTLDCHVTRKMP